MGLPETTNGTAIKSAELWESIRQVSAAGKSLSDMTAGLDVSSKDMKATLEEERRKLALVFLGTFSQSLYDAGKRYRDILTTVLDEIETRDLSQMRTRDLLRLADTIQKWLAPIYRAGALGPDKSDLEQASATNVTNIVALLQTINQVKRDAADDALTELP